MMSRWPLMTAVTLMVWQLGVAHADPTIAFNETPDPIGQQDCAERLNDTLNISVTANAEQTTDAFVLELVVYTNENTSCLTTLQNCPQIEVDDEGLCGCLDSRDGSPSSLDWSGSLGSLSADFAELMCANSTDLNFRGDLNYVDTEIASETSNTIMLETQLDPPSTPGNLTVQGADSALLINLDSSDRTAADVDRHEICVRRASASTSVEESDTCEPDSPSGNTLADLRGGFSTCKETTQLLTGNYRYENLENDVAYEVVVAAYDAAGNRSPNSCVRRGTPASLYDFAELYHDRLNGAEGESGGCTTTGSEGVVPLWVFGIMLFILRRRAVS